MNYHPVTKQITDLLEQNDFWFEKFEHEPVRTSEEAARIRPKYTLGQGAKALVLKVSLPNEGGSFVMAVLPANLKLDSKKLEKLLNVKSISFAAEGEVLGITNGVQVGGVPPFGNLFNLKVYADEKLFDNEKIVFNAGDRRFSVAMKSADYKTLVSPAVVSISK